jgi:hypothetical protein
LVELLPTISDARYQATGLLMAKTVFLGQITDFVTLVCGYEAAAGLTAIGFLIGHGHLLFPREQPLATEGVPHLWQSAYTWR